MLSEISLRIHVNTEYSKIHHGQIPSRIDSGGGFSAPTLLDDKGYDLNHNAITFLEEKFYNR
jgi:hypothetical protein